MRKILKKIGVLQEKTIHQDNRFKRRTFVRINPFNPLSYVAIISILVVGIITFGLVGFWRQIKIKNPFKWQ